MTDQTVEHDLHIEITLEIMFNSLDQSFELSNWR
jgi:hypothetical protein